MLNTKSKDQKGFTIIEVLIVLAIAGLILLIVFLAVPALQRNSRNTGRKSDISRIGGAATEYVSNNNGTLPIVGSTAARDSIIKSAGTLGQYDFTTATGVPTNLSIVAAGAKAVNSVDKIQIAVKAVCGVNGVTGPGTARQMALQSAVETGGGGVTSICIDI
jgi:prepilin-type N-terminal cleavage/methylation domain-containing protein